MGKSLSGLIIYPLYLRINFYSDWSQSPYCILTNQSNTDKYLQGFAIYQSKFA